MRSPRFRFDFVDDPLLLLAAGNGLIERDALLEYSLLDLRPPPDDGVIDGGLSADGGWWSTAVGDRDRERGDRLRERLLER